jgi:hypothetical protein
MYPRRCGVSDSFGESGALQGYFFGAGEWRTGLVGPLDEDRFEVRITIPPEDIALEDGIYSVTLRNETSGRTWTESSAEFEVEAKDFEPSACIEEVAVTCQRVIFEVVADLTESPSDAGAGVVEPSDAGEAD